MSKDTFKDLEDVVEDTPVVQENKALTTNIFDAPASLDELLEDNAGLDMQFASIKIPAGGSTTFELEDPTTGETNPIKEIKGIILASTPTNVYYKDAYTGESVPPDCHSVGGVIGTLLEDGSQRECRDCPFNQFGSGTNGSKACQNRILLYVLVLGESLPRLFSLPATSKANYDKFRTQLFMRKKKLASAVVSIKLEKVQSKTGIAYSRPTFTWVGETSNESPEQQQAAVDSIAILKCMGMINR